MARKIILVAIFIILAVFVVFRINEDTWICDDGEWIEHGRPSAPMPEGKCAWRDNFNLRRAAYGDR